MNKIKPLIVVLILGIWITNFSRKQSYVFRFSRHRYNLHTLASKTTIPVNKSLLMRAACARNVSCLPSHRHSGFYSNYLIGGGQCAQTAHCRCKGAAFTHTPVHTHIYIYISYVYVYIYTHINVYSFMYVML